MDETDFDALCEGASPSEAKRLRKILSEWCDGDENSFPVHMALLTRAQWRAAARVPHLVNGSRKLMELMLMENRQQVAVLVTSFANTADAKTKVLESMVTVHSETVKKTVAEIRSQLTNTEIVAAHIQGTMERSMLAWKIAKADFESERQKLEQAREELESRTQLRDLIWVGLLLLAVLGTGIAIGLRMAR